MYQLCTSILLDSMVRLTFQSAWGLALFFLEGRQDYYLGHIREFELVRLQLRNGNMR